MLEYKNFYSVKLCNNQLLFCVNLQMANVFVWPWWKNHQRPLPCKKHWEYVEL